MNLFSLYNVWCYSGSIVMHRLVYSGFVTTNLTKSRIFIMITFLDKKNRKLKNYSAEKFLQQNFVYVDNTHLLCSRKKVICNNIPDMLLKRKYCTKCIRKLTVGFLYHTLKYSYSIIRVWGKLWWKISSVAALSSLLVVSFSWRNLYQYLLRDQEISH